MLLVMLLFVLPSARVALRVVKHMLCIEFFVSYCLACMTTHIIKRASRSVVRQVHVEVDFCATSTHFRHFGAKQSIQKRPSKCVLLAIRSTFGTRQNAANYSDVSGGRFLCDVIE